MPLVTQTTSNKFANLSFVCACLVVFIHVPTFDLVPGTIYSWTCQFFKSTIGEIAVPFFFLASGFFLAGHVYDKNWWSKAIVRRFKTLIIPFWIVSVVSFVLIYAEQFLCAKVFHTAYPQPVSLRSFVDLLGLDLAVFPSAMQFWFIRSLFVYVVLSLPIVLIARTKYMWWMLFFLVFVIGELMGCGDTGIFYCTLKFNCLLYFVIGLYFRLHALNVTVKGYRWVIAFSCVAIAIAMRTTDLPHWVKSLRIMFLIAGCWLAIPEKKWPRVLASNIFAIYLFHVICLHFLFDIARHVPMIQLFAGNSIGFMACGFVAIAVSILIAEFLRRKCVRLSNILFGGR